MERKPYCENRITKTKEFLSRTTRKLGSSKEVDKDSKRSHEEVVWQEKEESTRTEDWEQHMARGQEYSIESTLKEAGPEKIQIF